MAGGGLVKLTGILIAVHFVGCFDLKTLWSLLGMSVAALTDFNDTTCFCPWCNVTNRASDKGCCRPGKHRKLTHEDHLSSLLLGILPLKYVFFCCLHAKMRITEMLLRRLGERAVEKKHFTEWVLAVAKVTTFWAGEQKDGKGIKIPMMMGRRIEQILEEVIFNAAAGATGGAFLPFVQAVYAEPGN